jgi:hypothetical protein
LCPLELQANVCLIQDDQGWKVLIRDDQGWKGWKGMEEGRGRQGLRGMEDGRGRQGLREMEGLAWAVSKCSTCAMCEGNW